MLRCTYLTSTGTCKYIYIIYYTKRIINIRIFLDYLVLTSDWF